MLEKAIREGKKSEVDFQVYVAQNAQTLLAIQLNAKLINQAMDLGLSVERADELNFSKLMSDVKVSEHERISKINLG